MNIAIIAPSSVPFVVGGAENLWWGLQTHINQCTPHRAELVKVPIPENDLWDVVAGYRKFWDLDLNHFDLVISTKNPAWMVRHPNHVCYMQHCLRGLYDTYHMTGLPTECRPRHAGLMRLVEFMQTRRGDPAVMPEWFDRLQRIRAKGDVPADEIRFPGPFARLVVHFLDSVGLSEKSIQRYTAISKNVAGRPGYFPPGARVEVIYHPSFLPEFKSGPGQYFFTVSRLHGSKRVELLVDAMKFVRTKIDLLIAGTGPQEQYLRKRAAGDGRIKFLGQVNDREIIDLYASALAVPFVPHDEDYGLITIEAMRSGKPVLTTKDSGGPNEFVQDGITGYSVRAEPAALAERMDYFAGHRAEAALMGQNAAQTVSEITWDNVVNRLLNEGRQQSKAARPQLQRRRKMTVAVNFPIFPPVGGGQHRTFHLFKQLAKHYDVELITLAADEFHFHGKIAPGLWEIRIPRSVEHFKAEEQIASTVDWLSISDVVLPKLIRLTPAYTKALEQSASTADCAVASHPYLYPAIKEIWAGPVWYDAHNVEAVLKEGIFPRKPAGFKLLESVVQVEQACCRDARLILACSREDQLLLNRLYATEDSKTVIVPNGVDLSETHFVSPEDRAQIRARHNIAVSDFISVFIGSWHGPNLDAVRSILGFARLLPEMKFLIIGSACGAFKPEEIPANVGLMGVVSESEKRSVFALADLALNPIVTGSGTNLKVLDYCGAGLPVLSTPFGVRGLSLQQGVHLQLAELFEFPKKLREIRLESKGSAALRVLAAKYHMAAHFDWNVIGENLFREIESRGDVLWKSRSI